MRIGGIGYNGVGTDPTADSAIIPPNAHLVQLRVTVIPLPRIGKVRRLRARHPARLTERIIQLPRDDVPSFVRGQRRAAQVIPVQPERIVVRIAHRHPLGAKVVILRAVPHAGRGCGDRRIAHVIRRREVERVPHPRQRRREGVRPRAARGQGLPASLTLLVDQLAPVQPGPRIAGAPLQFDDGSLGHCRQRHTRRRRVQADAVRILLRVPGNVAVLHVHLLRPISPTQGPCLGRAEVRPVDPAPSRVAQPHLVQSRAAIAGAQIQGHAGTVRPAVTIIDLDAAAGSDVVHPDAVDRAGHQAAGVVLDAELHLERRLRFARVGDGVRVQRHRIRGLRTGIIGFDVLPARRLETGPVFRRIPVRRLVALRVDVDGGGAGRFTFRFYAPNEKRVASGAFRRQRNGSPECRRDSITGGEKAN